MARNVQVDYGAAGDGVTDDTAAIQTALDDCSTGGTYPGEQLLFPAGTYRVTASLDIDTAGNYNLLGEGPHISVISADFTSATAGILRTAATSTARSRFYIEGLGVTCSTPGTVGYAIAFQGGSTSFPNDLVVIRNCKFSNCALGGIRSSNLVKNCLITECEFLGNNLQAYASSSTSGSDISGRFENTTISNCYVHDSGTSQTTNGTSWGFYLNSIVKNVTITGCRFIDRFGGGIAIGTSTDSTASICGVSITSNIFVNNVRDDVGVVVCQGVTITGNTHAKRTGITAITLGNDVRGFTVSGNSLSCPDVDGVTYTQASAIVNAQFGASCGVIANNSAIYPLGYVFGAGLLVGNATDVLIRNNNIIGYYIGIGVYADNSGADVSGITIEGNQVVIPTGAIRKTPGTQGFLGAGITAGIVVNGNSDNVTIRDNRVRNTTYGVALSRRNALAAGNPERVIVERNRLQEIQQAGLWILSETSVDSVKYRDNLGTAPLKIDSVSYRNLNYANNLTDSNFWHTRS